jgi:Pyridoxamine 5'-phosphate oxidase
MSWRDFELANSELAAFGAARLHGQVAYLATLRPDGSPRVHPVTPIIREGHMFVFMEPTSPKGRELLTDGRYALHCAVSDTSGSSGEFQVSGRALLVTDLETRELAKQICTYTPRERYVLYEFAVQRVSATTYQDGKPVYSRWTNQA